MTLIEFDQVMTQLKMQYTLGVILFLDSASDYSKQAKLLDGKNQEACEKAKHHELEFQKAALDQAIYESMPCGQRYEDLADQFTKGDIKMANNTIARWNKILSRFNKIIDLIPER